jgi:hypothetical protein
MFARIPVAFPYRCLHRCQVSHQIKPDIKFACLPFFVVAVAYVRCETLSLDPVTSCTGLCSDLTDPCVSPEALNRAGDQHKRTLA